MAFNLTLVNLITRTQQLLTSISEDHPVTDPSLSVIENNVLLDSFLQNCDSLKTKLRTALNKLEKANRSWFNYINTLAGDTKKTENELYETTLRENNYFETINFVQDKLEMLKDRTNEANLLKVVDDQLRTPTRSLASGSAHTSALNRSPQNSPSGTPPISLSSSLEDLSGTKKINKNKPKTNKKSESVNLSDLFDDDKEADISDLDISDALNAKSRVAKRLFTPNKSTIKSKLAGHNHFSLRKAELERDTLSDIILGDRELFYNDPTVNSDLDLVDVPKTTIRVFDGNPLHALDFWESFRVGVHLKRIPVIKKLQLLRNYTAGPVFNAIKSYPIIKENYKVCLITVYVKFCEPKKLVQCYYAKLHLIGIASENTYSLRTTLENVSVLISNLVILKENINTYPMGMEVRNKFPLSIIEKINELCPIDEVETCLEILDEIISNKEMALHLRNPLKSIGSIKNDSQRGNYNSYSKRGRGYRNGYRNKFRGEYNSSSQKFSNSRNQYKSPDSNRLLTNYNSSFTRAGFYNQNQPQSYSVNFVESTNEPNALGDGPKPKNNFYNPGFKRNNCLFCNGMHYSSDCRVYPGYNERVDRLNQQNRCYACLQSGHRSFDCKSPKTCFFCKGQHPSVLCKKHISEVQIQSTSFSPPIQKQQNSIMKNTASNSVNNKKSKKSVKFQSNKNKKFGSKNTSLNNSVAVDQSTSSDVQVNSYIESSPNLLTGYNKESILLSVPVELTNPSYPKGISAQGLCLLDSGSQKTFILNEISVILKLAGEKTELTLFTFGNDEPEKLECDKVNVNIKLQNGGHKLITAHTKALLSRPIKTIPLTDLDIQKVKLDKSSVLMMDSEKIPPILVIGMDYYYDFINSNVPEFELNSGYKLLSTSLGPIIAGHGQLASKFHNSVNVNECVHSYIALDDSTKPDISKFWTLENVGISDDIMVNDDDIALSKFNESIKFEEGRYFVRLPWKEDNPHVPSNFKLAFGRLKNEYNKLKRNTGNLETYDKVFKDYLNKGILKEVPLYSESNLIHYIPHHDVWRPDKDTTKLRVVLDGSAKTSKTDKSLNQHLYRGPVMLPELAGLLLRFRTYPIVMSCDVEKAFLQVGLNEIDRSACRILWVRNIDLPPTEDNLICYEYQRVVFGLNCSPFLLAATISYHLNKVDTPLAREILKNIYVDNIILHVKDKKEARSIYQETKELFNSCSMNLREYISNNFEINKFLKEKEGSLPNPISKVLGVQWDSQKDSLEIQIPKFAENEIITKRNLLTFLAKIFDPLGYLAPTVIKLKTFIKYLWSQKYEWDDVLSDEDIHKWYDVIDSWNILNFSFDRLLFKKYPTQNVQLHVFCDASKIAFAAVSYLRVVTDEGSIKTKLLFSKNRLSPEKATTIPRLELMGVLIGKRLAKYVLEEIGFTIDKTIIWTDSTVVLGWLKSHRDFSKFVSNRIKEIKTLKNLTNCEFRYVNTKMNPADLSTRGLNTNELHNSDLWWNGPKFLRDNEKSWDEFINAYLYKMTLDFEEYKEEIEKDERPIHKKILETDVNLVSSDEIVPIDSIVIKPENFSHYNKMLRTVCLILRFLCIKVLSKCTIKNVLFKKLSKVSLDGNITSKDYQIAEFLLVYQSQARNPPSKKHIKSLNLIKNTENLWYMKTRLTQSSLPSTNVSPILLPKGDPFTRLYIMNIHKKNFHSGTQHTLSQIRQKYWIPKGRNFVNFVLHKDCYQCKIARATPYTLPEMPPLPSTRVNEVNPFLHTGLDYFGPIFVRLANERYKVWVCLFTCMTTRAIHLEVVKDLSAITFLYALRRFISRRGKPNLITSDNASQFHLVEKTMQLAWADILNDSDVINYTSSLGIDWKFIPERTPHMAGFYERMVGITKTAFKRTIGRNILEFDLFCTIMTEIETVVNCRPLTHIYNDEGSLSILRPIDFLHPHLSPGTPVLEENHLDLEWTPNNLSSSDKLIRHWRKTQKHLDEFWNYWREEYLNHLIEEYRHNHRGPFHQYKFPPRIDEVVLIKDDELVRGQWRFGVITELHRGRDGQIRTATCRTSNGNYLRRPINSLYPFELSARTYNEEPIIVPNEESDEQPSNNEQISDTENNNSESDKENTYQGPARRTRSRTRNNTIHLLSYLNLLVGMLISFISIFDFACGLSVEDQHILEGTDLFFGYKTNNLGKVKISDQLDLIYTERCLTQGIAIYDNKGNLTFSYVECPEGSLNHVKFVENSTVCGKPCKCVFGWLNHTENIKAPQSKAEELNLQSLHAIVQLANNLLSKEELEILVNESKKMIAAKIPEGTPIDLSEKIKNNQKTLQMIISKRRLKRDLGNSTLVNPLSIAFNQIVRQKEINKLKSKRRSQDLGPHSHLEHRQCSYLEMAIDLEVLKNESNVNLPVVKIIEESEIPKSVCSFTPSHFCSNQSIPSTFNFIMLYDQTMLIVDELRINRPIMKKEICVGPQSGKVFGPTDYCQNNKCSTSGTRLCFYSHYDSVKFALKNGNTILISAWGTIALDYYPFSKTESVSQSCQNCNVTCIKNGVSVNLVSGLDRVEACGDYKCLHVSFPNLTEYFYFPHEIIIHSYKVKVKIWKSGEVVLGLETVCEAIPFCETITCNFCYTRFLNIHCVNHYTWAAIFAVAYLVLMLVYPFLICMYFCVLGMIKLMKIMYKIFHFLFVRPIRAIFNKAGYSQLAIIFYFQLGFINSCSDVTTMTATQKRCYVSSNNETCRFDETTTMTLSPIGQESCLNLKNDRNLSMANLVIRLESLSVRCKAVHQYHTRPYEIKVSYSDQCPWVKSCQNDNCEKTTLTSKISELGNEANNSPGYTYCTNLCGCWGCNCFKCSDACLFYRAYAKPKGSNIYEIFNCPTYETVVKVVVTKQISGNAVSHQLELFPGKPSSFEDIEVTVTSIMNIPAPILNTQFMTDGQKTVKVEAAHEGQPNGDELGSLQCPSEEKARNFECTFPSSAFKCHTSGRSVSCDSNLADPELFMTDPQRQLPLSLSGITLAGQGKNIEAKYDYSSALSLQVTAKNYEVTTQIDINYCFITPISLSGCYLCNKGAIFNFYCKTDLGTATVEVTCSSVKFVTSCDTSNKTYETYLYFQKSRIDEKCVATCTAGVKTFSLIGRLNYVETKFYNNASLSVTSVGNGPNPNVTTVWDKFVDKFDTALSWAEDIFEFVFSKNIIYVIIFVIFVIAAVLFTIFCLPSIISFILFISKIKQVYSFFCRKKDKRLPIKDNNKNRKITTQKIEKQVKDNKTINKKIIPKSTSTSIKLEKSKKELKENIPLVKTNPLESSKISNERKSMLKTLAAKHNTQKFSRKQKQHKE